METADFQAGFTITAVGGSVENAPFSPR